MSMVSIAGLQQLRRLRSCYASPR